MRKTIRKNTHLVLHF